MSAPDKRHPIEIALVTRMLAGQWNYATIGVVAVQAGGNERDADRIVRHWRRKGWAEFWRYGGRTIWRTTPAGRLAHESPAPDWADVGPELLASLEELMGDYAGGADRASDDPYIMERALAAITKANALLLSGLKESKL